MTRPTLPSAGLSGVLLLNMSFERPGWLQKMRTVNCWSRLIPSLIVQIGRWRPEAGRDSSKDRRSPQMSWVSSYNREGRGCLLDSVMCSGH